MGVEGSFAVAEAQVPLAVRTKAIQRFRDFEVVFAKVGNTYEVRMLTIGRRTPEWTEVLGGLEPGTDYVTDGAFLIRADIEKSGASHDHSGCPIVRAAGTARTHPRRRDPVPLGHPRRRRAALRAIGRAPVRTPVTNAPLVCRLLLVKK